MQNIDTLPLGKRIFDISICLVLLPLAILLCALVCLPIAVEARASPFFRQWRVGQHERPFRILKLRTMRPDAPSVASHVIGADSMLKSGKFVRATKIDELPQLWNVLRGEMSLVGPRPCLFSQSDLIEARRSEGVFALLPGISGVSQIRGLDMSTPELLACTDAAYMVPWRLTRDVKIVLLTAFGKGQGDAAIRIDSGKPTD